jgi:hypothetical protein
LRAGRLCLERAGEKREDGGASNQRGRRPPTS